MRKLILTTAAIFVDLPAFAAELSMGAELGKSMDEVKASLASLGYEVRKGEMEDGMIEVYALKDGKRYELYLDAALQIVRTKIDD